MSTVYICTRGRIPNLFRVVPRWLNQNFHVVIVVEKDELKDHREFRSDLAKSREDPYKALSQIDIRPLPKKNQGLGYARNYAVLEAHRGRLKSIIYSDDDIRPGADSDMSILTEAARSNEVLAIGAATRIQDHFTKGAVSANSGIMLAPGCWAHRMFALNVLNTIEVGNFDVNLGVLGDDDELQRQGIYAEFPWAVHCDVWAESIGARFQAGGVESLTNVSEKRTENHKYMHDIWPEYVSAPPKKYRTAWQRMMDDFIPEWRERSAMHGGSW